MMLDNGTQLKDHFLVQIAAANGFEDVLKLFIKNGVDVSLPISEYQIPLLEAVFGGDSGIVKLLLENGADPEPDCCAVEENQAGQSPL